MHLVGYDLLSRPVMYSCLEMVTNRNIEDNRRHMISTFEQVLPQKPQLQASSTSCPAWHSHHVATMCNTSNAQYMTPCDPKPFSFIIFVWSEAAEN